MTTACPRCQSQRFTFGIAYGDSEIQIVAGSALSTVPQLVESGDHPSDTFGFLVCGNCDLTLANDPGEGRLRKASLYGIWTDFLDHVGTYEGEDVQALGSAMEKLAEHLCDHAFDPLPEIEHTVTGINLSEVVHQGLDQAIGRPVVQRYKSSAETILEGLSPEEIVKVKTFLRLSGATYEESLTTRWTPQN